MKIICRTAPAFLALLLLGSCAKTESEGYEQKELASFNTWMQLNVIDQGRPVEKRDNGMYVEWLHRAPGDAKKPGGGDWLMLDSRGYSLYTAPDTTGNLFMTRYRQDAKMQGTFTYYTHYVPQYLPFNNAYNGLTQGENLILNEMKLGDSVRIYLPSKLAYQSYGTSFGNGYGGQTPLAGNVPAIIELALREIVPDPTAHENEQVKAYATGHWSMPEADTLRPHFYMDIYEQGPADQDTISVDSAVYYKYTGRFLDGFIFDTNDSTSYQERFQVKPFTALAPLQYSSSLIQAFQDAFKGSAEKDLKLRYGAKFRMVFSSVYGYGTSGNSASSPSSTSSGPYTVIQPYTPLIFDVQLLKKATRPTDAPGPAPRDPKLPARVRPL